MMIRRFLSVLLLTLTLLANQAQARDPFLNAAATKKIGEDEQRLWYESKSFQKAIRRGGKLHPSKELQAYLQSVMDKLYPEFEGMIKVHVIQSHVLNAFAIPNGGVYMHTGMLSRFDNEAQLATVLAHEGAHFIYRHGYYSNKSVKRKTGLATIAGVIGVPPVWGMLGNMLLTSSVYGFSRELETEADRVGYERLKAAGYDVTEAAKTFEHLATEVKLADIEEPVFFSTHPKLQNRIDSFNKLAAIDASNGVTNVAQYESYVINLRLEGLAAELSLGRYKHLITLLTNQQVFDRYPPTAHYYLAEAYRKRNETGDPEYAMLEAEIAIAQVPDFAPTYRTKGMLLMAKKENQAAQAAFKQYLTLAPDAKDKSYINAYVETLNAQPESKQKEESE